MFPEFEVCNTTRSTIPEEHFLGTVIVLNHARSGGGGVPTNFCLHAFNFGAKLLFVGALKKTFDWGSRLGKSENLQVTLFS